MSAHTPGPWLQSSTVLVCDSKARIIANCTPLVDIPELAIPISNVGANARLIAAAPDLLAALQGIANAKRFDRTIFHDDDAFVDWAQSIARAALVKALP
jgi:hypothetical protein